MTPRNYPPAVESRIEDATRILTHYVRMALPDADPQDTRAEMRDVVLSIIEASELLAHYKLENIGGES
jgi:hypothetical protein